MPRSFLIKKKTSKRNKNLEKKSHMDENTPSSLHVTHNISRIPRTSPCKEIVYITQRSSVLTPVNEVASTRIHSNSTLSKSVRTIRLEHENPTENENSYCSGKNTSRSGKNNELDVGTNDIVIPTRVTPTRDVVNHIYDVHDVSIERPRHEQSEKFDSLNDTQETFHTSFCPLPDPMLGTSKLHDRYSPISPFQPQEKLAARTPSPIDHVADLNFVLETKHSPMLHLQSIDRYPYPDERKENVVFSPEYRTSLMSPLTSPHNIVYRKWANFAQYNSEFSTNEAMWPNPVNTFYSPTVPGKLPLISERNTEHVESENMSPNNTSLLAYRQSIDKTNQNASHVTSSSYLTSLNISPSYLALDRSAHQGYGNIPECYGSNITVHHPKPPHQHVVTRKDLHMGDRLMSVFDGTVEKKKARDHMLPRYKCEHCSKSYSTLSGVTKHKQFHCTSQIKKEFHCKFCDKMYTSLGALKMHIRTHTLPCKCQICGKAFSRPWLLQGHVRTHTGEKPFQCPHCGRSFADRSNLRAHLQTHSDVKKYSCKNCSKTFSRMSLLIKHEDGGCSGFGSDDNMDICAI